MTKRKERDIIAIIGRTNVGKSSLLNLLSGQEDYAIVDKTPGTTTDTVRTVMEIHDLGPFKILDTAGIDEYSNLGDKKRKKTFEAIEEADLSLIVINQKQNDDFNLERELCKRIQTNKKQALVIVNIFDNTKVKKNCASKIKNRLNLPVLFINVHSKKNHRSLVDFIKKNYSKEIRDIDLLPNVKEKGFVLLVIPMDEETPTLRLLRPQDMALERILRRFAIPVLFRLDLKKARHSDKKIVQKEFVRYNNLLSLLKKSDEGLQLVITDSQAFDITPQWTNEDILLTSFSIMMAHYMSQGNLDLLLNGAKAIDDLKSGNKILIAESCNHNRKCNDIGTIQIPKILEKKVGGKLNFEFNFGRSSFDNLKQYDLIIHCGACMIDRQKYARRLLLAQKANVPITNYGIFLAYTKNIEVAERAMKPFLKKTQ